jgi:hypothetical protein
MLWQEPCQFLTFQVKKKDKAQETNQEMTTSFDKQMTLKKNNCLVKNIVRTPILEKSLLENLLSIFKLGEFLLK